MFALELVEINLPVTEFPKQLLHHGFSTHSDVAMYFPAGNYNSCGEQRFRPCIYVLVIAVD
jgi:hypothetical protein